MMMDEPSYIPNPAAHAEGELPEDDGPTVVYTGRSNIRKLTRADLAGVTGAEDSGDTLMWTPGVGISWAEFLDFAGSEERAAEVLAKHRHEFKLVGLDLEVADEEEFAIGGAVA